MDIITGGLQSLSIDSAAQTVTLDKSTLLPFNPSEPKKSKQVITIYRDEVLPPRTEKLILGHLEQPDLQTCFTEEHPQFDESYCDKLAVARALVVVRNKKVPIRVMNFSEEPVRLYEGKRIAIAHIIEDEESVCSVTTQQENNFERMDLTHINEINLQDSSLTEDQKDELYQLLVKYADVFSQDKFDVGQCTMVQHAIDTGDAKPLRSKVYRIPQTLQVQVKEQIDEMTELGFIKPSSSPWSCGIVLVPKPDGSIRFCCDYRRLNKVTKKDVYPLPLIQDVIDQLSGSNMFTSLDLAHGFWQVPVEEESKEKTAFITPWGLFEWNVMSFGLCNAPATFSRCLGLVLSGMKHQNVLCYVDDIIIHSKTWTEHLSALEELLQRLRAANLKVKGSKCQMARTSITYLGQIISKEGVRIDESQLNVIKDYPAPRNVKEIQRVMGLFNYYRKWIPKYSFLAKPIMELLRKDRIFKWTHTQETAFQESKGEIGHSTYTYVSTMGTTVQVDL